MHQPQSEVQVNSVDRAQLIWIPEGEFLLGSSENDITTIVQHNPSWNAQWFAQEKPQRTVTLPGFWIYKYPVTVAQYREYSAATDGKMPQEPEWGWQDDHPIVNVSWDEVTRYAEWAKALIPSEAQWEKAARGTEGQWWPWGNDWNAEHCANASNAKSTQPVTSNPSGASPYGVMEMAGNVWEWCAAAPHGEYDRPPLRPNQRRQASPSGHVLRGGSWQCAFDAYLRCAFRCFDCDQQRGFHAYRRPTCGFRCVVLP